MSQFKTIIFDLGGVLIDWNPEYVFLKEFRGNREKMDWFLNEICAWEWNMNQDAGYPLAQATEDRVAMFPEYEELIRMYYGRWEEMLGDPLEEVVEVLSALKSSGISLYILSNWSAETYPVAETRFDFLHWFDGKVISGETGMIKPDPNIYKLLMKTYGLTPQKTVFIDDKSVNVEAADALGIHGIHYKNASKLRNDLGKLKLL